MLQIVSSSAVVIGALRVKWIFSGSLNGTLSSVTAHDLGTVCIKEALSRASVSPDQVSEVILGQVLTAGNPTKYLSNEPVRLGFVISIFL